MSENVDPHAAQPSAPHDEPQTSPTGKEDDVLSMIAEMESRLGRLKNAKAAEQQRLSTLVEREQHIAEQAEALEELRAEFARRQEEFTREQHALTEARQRFDAEQHAFGEAQQAFESREATAREQFETLKNLETELESRETKLSEEWEAVKSLQQEMDERQMELARLQHGLEEAKDQARIFEETAAYEQEERQKAEQGLARLREEHSAAQEQIAATEQQLTELREQLEATRRAEEEARGEIDVTKNELAAAQTRLDDAEAQLQQARTSLEETQGELTTAKAACENFEQEAHQQQQAFDLERTQAEERFKEATTQIGALEQQIAVLTHDFEAAKQEAERTREEMTALQGRLDEATRTHQTALEETQAEASRQVEQATQELEQQRAQLEAAKVKLREFAGMIEEQTDATEQVVYLGEQIEQQQTLIGELKSQLRHTTEAGAGDDSAQAAEFQAQITAFQAQLDESQQECEQLRAQLTQAAAAPNGPAEELLARQLDERDAQIDELTTRLREAQQSTAGVDEAVVQRLQQRISTLQDELEQVQAIDPSAMPAELTSQAQQLGELQQFMRTRRRRLRSQRELLSDRSQKLLSVQEVLQQRHQQCEEVLAEKNAVAELKNKLARAESKLIAKWAAARGTIVAMLTMLTLVLLAGASYGLAYKFAPATFVASAVLKPEHPAGNRIGPDERAAWAASLQGMATSDAVLKAAADRMGQRGFTTIDEPNELKPYLKSSLAADVQADGFLRLEMQVPSRYPAERVMDTYAVALMQVANATRDQRLDDYTSRLGSAPAAEGQPVKDERLLYSAYIFGGLTFVTGLFCVGIRRSYAKAKPVFDMDDESFDLHPAMQPPAV